VNSPPHSTYGSIPNTNDSSQDRTIVINPDCSEDDGLVLTKMNGNIPVMNVTEKLIARGVNPESNPSMTDITIARNINIALISNALPMFVDIDFIVIVWNGFCFCKYIKKLWYVVFFCYICSVIELNNSKLEII
jgi:hypothetical protein